MPIPHKHNQLSCGFHVESTASMAMLCGPLCGPEGTADTETGPQQDVLVVGLPGSGKTLLARRLQTVHQKQQPVLSLATQATNGLELFSVPLPKGHPLKQLTIRELGGSMLPIWPKYYSNVHAVVFTLDVCDAASIAPAAVQLYELLQAPQLQRVPVCLAFTKADLPATLSRAELDLAMGLSELAGLYAGRLWMVDVSAVKTADECPELKDIVEWLAETRASPPPSARDASAKHARPPPVAA